VVYLAERSGKEEVMQRMSGGQTIVKGGEGEENWMKGHYK
jgi:hypothetical protein